MQLVNLESFGSLSAIRFEGSIWVENPIITSDKVKKASLTQGRYFCVCVLWRTAPTR